MLNQFYVPDTAATGQLLADVADGLAAAGHEVHVLCSERAYGGGETVYESQQSDNGVHVHRVAATGYGRKGMLGRVIDYLSFYVLAWRRAKAFPKMDVCISLTTPPFIAVVARRLKRRRGTRLVIWSMDLYPEVPVAFGVIRPGGLVHRITRCIARRLYRSADAIISLGEAMTRRLIEAGAPAERVTEIPNWVPGESVQPLPPRDTDGMTTLMYSGNLGMGHELDTILHATARLNEPHLLTVRFVGQGKMKTALEQLRDELGLPNVTFAPPVPLGELSENLAAGDVHLVAQRPGSEGLIVPSKLFGILAAGRAVLYVGPEDTEVAHIVRDADCGLLVPPGDISVAADALKALVDDLDTRRTMGHRAREAYETQFGRDRSVGKIVSLVEGLG